MLRVGEWKGVVVVDLEGKKNWGIFGWISVSGSWRGILWVIGLFSFG
jgi:hypothetical protein